MKLLVTAPNQACKQTEENAAKDMSNSFQALNLTDANRVEKQ